MRNLATGATWKAGLKNQMRITIVLLGAAFLPTIGCSTAGVQANSTMTSTDLKRMVQSRLATEPNLTYVEISADADLNKITLSGWVESEELRTQALYIVKTARTNLTVVDKIEVRPQVSMRNPLWVAAVR